MARHAIQRLLLAVPVLFGVLLLGFLLFWQVASRAGWINAAVLPPLDAIGAALWDGLAGGALLDDVAISLQRAGTAFAAASSTGSDNTMTTGRCCGVNMRIACISVARSSASGRTVKNMTRVR